MENFLSQDFIKCLVCPHTLKNLELENDGKLNWLKNEDCKYLVKDGTPILISEKNYKEKNKNTIDSIQKFWNKGWEKRVEEKDHSFLYKLDKESFFKRIIDQYNYEKSRGKNIGGYLSNEIEIDSLKNKISLIIGPGCGEEAVILNFLTKSKIIGLDISFQSANSTNYLLQKFNTNSGIGIQGDTRFIPILSKSLDFVFSHGVLHHSPDIEKSINEIYRVLKPGGKFLVALYNKYGFVWQKFLIKAVLKGNWNLNKLNTYISSETEKAWIASKNKNPYTKLFSTSECYDFFSKFINVKVRTGNFRAPNNLSLKFLKLFENSKIMSSFGSMNFISGYKPLE